MYSATRPLMPLHSFLKLILLASNAIYHYYHMLLEAPFCNHLALISQTYTNENTRPVALYYWVWCCYESLADFEPVLFKFKSSQVRSTYCKSCVPSIAWFSPFPFVIAYHSLCLLVKKKQSDYSIGVVRQRGLKTCCCL